MSKIFNHTVQPLGSNKSPVEDLAIEVAEAFDSLESVVDTSTSTVVSITDAIGNPLFQSLEKHKVIRDVTESHTILENESDIVLENEPDRTNITVSYQDPVSSSLISLVQIEPGRDYTNNNQFKVKGKVLNLNLRVPLDGSLTVSVTYRTESFGLNDKKFLSNVIKKEDNSFLITPEQITPNSFSLDYETNLADNLDDFIMKSGEPVHFFYTTDGDNFSKLEVESYSVTDNVITFITEDLELSNNPTVLAYVSNTSISEMLDALYFEFKNHSHSNHDLTKNIDVKDLVNRFVNDNLINYKSGDVTNYQFPQYMNREGYNENLDSVYENSMLGTLFLSRVITDSVQKFKGLDKDSNKIIFGDPILGPALNYNKDETALTLSSLGNINGLTIITNSDEKYSLKLNGSIFKSNNIDSLRIEPQGNTLSVVSKSPDYKYTLKYDNADSRGLSTLDNIKGKKVSINTINLRTDPDNLSMIVDYTPNEAGTLPTVKMLPELLAKKITVESLVSTNTVEFNTINAKDINFGSIKYNKVPEGVIISDNSDSKNLKIIYDVPVQFNKVKVTSLNSPLITPDTINIGDVVLSKNGDSINNGLVVWSNNPVSDIQFQSKVKFTDIEAEDIKSGTGDITNLLTDVLGIGDINILKNAEGNVEITSTTGNSKIIFKSPVELQEATSKIESTITLESLTSKLMKLGAHTFEEQANGDLLVAADPLVTDTKVHFKSKLKVDSLEPVLIKGENATGFIKELESKNIKIGTSTLSSNADNQLVIDPTTVSSDELIINTTTKINKAIIEELETNSFTVTTMNSDSFKIGDVLVNKDVDNNLVFTSTAPDKKVIFNSEANLNKAKVNELSAITTSSQEVKSKSVRVGNIALQKDLATESMNIVRSDLESEIKVEVPVSFNTATITNLISPNEATFNKLNMSALSVNNFNFKREEGTDNLELNVTKDVNSANNVFRIKSKTVASDLLAEIFSSNIYKMYNGDKISIDASNYLISNNNKFSFVGSNAVSIVGSSRKSGLNFSYDLNGTPIFKQYISANSGATAVDAEKNMFIELDTTDGMYFLRPTNRKISKNNIVHGFNDPTAQKDISDLRKWFRSNIFVGDADASSLNLAVGDGEYKNGLSIGETRLSVIGPNTECPSGLTIFESGDSLHLVKPLSPGQDGCRNLTYQEINTGGMNAKGELSVDGNASITESVIVNGTVATGNLSVSESTELVDTAIAGTLSVSGEATFLSSIIFKNDITLTNDLTSSGQFKIKSLEVDSDADIGKNLKVNGDISVAKDLEIGGSLSLKSGINSSGVIKSEGIDTSNLRAENLTLLGNATVAGVTVLQGKVEIKSSSQVQGNLDISSSLNVRESVTADNLFTLKDATISGTLRARDSVEFEGRSISIGADDSIIQLNGRLQFNTKDVTFNSPIKIFNTVRITDDTEIAGTLTNKSGILAESFINAKGSITTDSTLETKSNIVARTGTITQNFEVGSSLTANNITSTSLAITNNASIANLTISNSLSMPIDTSIVAGEVKFAAIAQTNSSLPSTFAGELSVSKSVEMLQNVSVGGNLLFNSGALTINSNGIKGTDAKIDVNTVLAYNIKGRERIQPPVELTSSSNPGAKNVSSLISQRDFVRIDHLVSEGISVFNQPLVANTIYYNDLIFIGDDESRTGAVNILAARALYA